MLGTEWHPEVKLYGSRVGAAFQRRKFRCSFPSLFRHCDRCDGRYALAFRHYRPSAQTILRDSWFPFSCTNAISDCCGPAFSPPASFCWNKCPATGNFTWRHLPARKPTRPGPICFLMNRIFRKTYRMVFSPSLWVLDRCRARNAVIWGGMVAFDNLMH
jgi:hypothetical protein